jgi:anaphase-promoting complex subunit 3
MLPHNPAIAAQLRQLIFYHLDNDLSQNALFFATRLHALDPRSSEAAHLLAWCHLRSGQLKAAYDYSRDKGFRGQHLGCAYVFAQACLGLERYQDGILALERSRGHWAARNAWSTSDQDIESIQELADLTTDKHSHIVRHLMPDASAVCCLLGKLLRANGEPKKAVDYYVEALKLNPFMWDAFTDLCDAGVSLHTANIFKMSPEMLAYASVSANGPITIDSLQSMPLQNQDKNAVTPGNDPFNPKTRTAGDPGLNTGGSNLLSRLNGSMKLSSGQRTDWETPTANGLRHDEDIMMIDDGEGMTSDIQAPHAPLRKPKTLQDMTSDSVRPISTRTRTRANADGNEPMESMRATSTSNHKRTVSGHTSQAASDATTAPARRSNRLLNSIKPSSSRLAAATLKDAESKEKRQLRASKVPSVKPRAASSTVGRVVSGNRKPLEPAEREAKEVARPPSAASSVREVARKPPPASAQNELSQEAEALQWLLDLLNKIGSGTYLLSRYQCQAALQALQSIPAAQRETPWVLAKIGRAHYEKASYAEADEIFSRIKKIAPSRMEDMEIYSTVLWHLKHEMDLAYLSHELIEADRLSPQAWCAIGNSFSLQREHEQAVKCFRRATQLDPKFAYAYTLQGHEHVANEEFEKALYAYRCAIAADSRHYNGWYGLGQVYEKLGKYDIAEKHYKTAAQINTTNPVLAVRIGGVLEKMKKPAAALTYFSLACDLDSRSASARFVKARALMRLGRPKDALVELEVLKDMAPDEATVHFMLGKLYKMMREKAAAIRHLTIALNLDPKVWYSTLLGIGGKAAN